MSNLNVQANIIAPSNLTARDLQYGDNRFYPSFENKTYNVLFNINKGPGKYLLKIEYLPIDNNILKLKAFLSTTRLLDVIDFLQLWRSKLIKHPELILNKKEDIKKSILGDDIMKSLNEINMINNNINNAQDANKQALLTLDYFDTFENLNFLGAASSFDKENLEKNIELFVCQYEDIKKDIKKKNTIEKIKILRMIDLYLDKNTDDKNIMIDAIFDIFDDLFIKEVNKNKKANIKVEDYLRLGQMFDNVINKKIMSGKLSLSKLKGINQTLNMLEEKVQKNIEKNEHTIAGIERKYRKVQMEKGFLLNEKAENNGKPYTEKELKEILTELSYICEKEGPNNFSSRLGGDIIIDLATTYKREPGAMIAMFQLAFSGKPFVGFDTKNDISYTMKVLQVRASSHLDHFGQSNEWFVERYQQEFDSERGNNKSILRNIKILQNL